MRFVETVQACGHPNILGTHAMTFEITRDHQLSERGDCVIGVNADKGASNLSPKFKQACKRDEARITMNLEAQGITETVNGFGDHNLSFGHSTEIVGRKSSFTSDRTVMIRADKAASDLDRRLIAALHSAKTRLNVRLIVEV